MKKNNYGFTLVELMAVITVLAIIAVIASPLVMNTISNSKSKLSEEQKRTVINAAKLYTVKNDHCGCVTIATLKEYGYLEDSEVIDPKNGSELTGGVTLNWKNNQYSYEYTDNCPATTKETAC